MFLSIAHQLLLDAFAAPAVKLLIRPARSQRGSFGNSNQVFAQCVALIAVIRTIAGVIACLILGDASATVATFEELWTDAKL